VLFRSALTGAASANVLKAGDTMTGVLAVTAGTAALPAITPSGDPNTGIFSPGADQVAISTNGTGRLTIDASGNVNIDSNTLYVDATNNRVGLGGSSPTATLAINSSNTLNSQNISFLTSDAVNSTLRIGHSSGNTVNIGANVGHNIKFGYYTSSLGEVSAFTPYLNLDSSGRVGIGTTQVQGYTNLNTVAISGTEGAILDFAASAVGIGNNRVAQLWGGNGGFLAFATGASNTLSERARIDSSGRLLVGTSTARTNFYNGSVSPSLNVESIGDGLIACVRNVNGPTAASLALAKSRGTTIGSNTLVLSGDAVGQVSFQGSDGSEFVEAARIEAFVDGTPGANDMPGRLVFSTTADGASSPTEALRIDTNGTQFCGAAGTVHVAGTTASAGTTTACYVGKRNVTRGNAGGTGTDVFLVWSNGNVVNTNNSYGAISDIKLKENIIDANSQWSDVKALQVRNYNFKEEIGQQTHTQIGLIAQEAELVSPGLVFESPDRDAAGNDLGTVTKSVNYSVLYMKAVKALQEAMERIETLEAKVAALEAS
jgi:hypothetical protein